MWPETAQEWLTLIASVLGIIATASGMISALLKRYRDTLNKATQQLDESMKLLEEQQNINIEQAKAIKQSIEDRGEIKKTLRAISTAQQTQMQIEINKLSDRAINRGKITTREKAQLKPLWDAYENNQWNHIQRGKVLAALELPVVQEMEGKNGLERIYNSANPNRGSTN